MSATSWFGMVREGIDLLRGLDYYPSGSFALSV